ncbi:Predicted O-methyltransferase YrrM [Tenacibaculum sp. MAR_2009_124]|uniref:O-methyltransferase n=1 Tax=Tenacibaculum sp. MAR_2009_124 TaxID=1250059 RepID=UPI000898ACDC|nr:class I SAM-dependent methyltransferase [Tenacibaculum sp. MAR_2009_124]SEC32398.1 Predicted O-methyltransferase YrrM [Tenacibaculum sp. MAR_2009_124]
MNKIIKHLLILNRRLRQSSVLKQLSQIENKTLQQILTAFISVKTNSHQKVDVDSFRNCENYRKKLLEDTTEITYEIFSLDTKSTVKDICKKASSKSKWCRLIYHIVNKTDSPKVLEIGTNLGVSGAYILEALKTKEGKLTTMEGLPKLCEISRNKFSEIVSNSKYEIVQGLYDDTFSDIKEREETYNLFFIDGNHQKDPTLEYFHELKLKMENKAVFIFDDIYWNEGMKEAWEVITNDKDVNFSIDMYQQGIAIIDKEETQKNRKFSLHLTY